MTTKGNDHLTSSSKVNELVLEGVNVENIPLNVHQGTVVESAGEENTEKVQNVFKKNSRHVFDRWMEQMLKSSSR